MPEAGTTLLDRYRSVVADDPDRVAVIDPDGTAVTAGQLVDRAERAGAGLLRVGLRRGRHLGVFLPNRSTWVVAALAASRAGVGVLGLNTRFREAELNHLLGLADVDTVVVADRFLGVDGPGLMAGLERPPRVLVDHDPQIAPTPTSWSRVEAGPAPETGGPSPQGRAGDPLIGFTTSGTTGFPKIAMHTGAQTVDHLDAAVASFGLGPTTVTLVPLPLCGAFGYTLTMATLLAGGRVVLHDTWDPDRAAADIGRHGVTFFSASDDMLLSVASSRSFDPVTTWRIGGFADFTNRGPEVVHRLDERTGGRTRLAGLYGSSEGFALMATFDHADPVEQRTANGGHLVGPAMAVRACDPETGRPLPHGQPGELQFRGPNLVDGYLDNPEATARAFTADGWYRSGDLGHTIEADRRGHQGFVFRARMGDALRLRGFLCDPAEIETHLERHPAVELAQVVGVSRPGLGDVAVAFVRLVDGGDGQDGSVTTDLAGHCRRGLANYKRPARIVVIDEFPVTDGPNGAKIRKVELRERAELLLGSAD
jgi:fatty-acyl-CoA synthase